MAPGDLDTAVQVEPHCQQPCTHTHTLTVCLVQVMKAFLLDSSAASRLNFFGLDSTMRSLIVKKNVVFFPLTLATKNYRDSVDKILSAKGY